MLNDAEIDTTSPGAGITTNPHAGRRCTIETATRAASYFPIPASGLATSPSDMIRSSISNDMPLSQISRNVTPLYPNPLIMRIPERYSETPDSYYAQWRSFRILGTTYGAISTGAAIPEGALLGYKERLYRSAYQPKINQEIRDVAEDGNAPPPRNAGGAT